MRKAAERPVSKDKLLDAAQGLVLERGFAATSVDDICKSARLTKGSFFHYFKSKDDLGAELLKRYCRTTKDDFLSSCCCENEKDPLKRVYEILDFFIQKGKKMAGESKGCLLGSMAQELADTHPEIRSICSQGFEGMAGMLKENLKEAKAKHAPKNPAIDPESLAEHFVVVLEGTQVVNRVRKGGAKLEGLKHYKAYIRSLFGR